MSRALVVAVIVAAAGAGCARTLPDQDRRIVSAAPDARLSADILWKDFQTNASSAARHYHGEAVVISGTVTRIDRSAVASSIFFAQSGERGITANLLDDDAVNVVKAATQGQRLTLKCFCEGTDGAGNIVLKSCVKP